MTYLDWRDAFADALDSRFYPIEYLDGLVASGAVQFWFGDRAAVCGRIKEFPGGALVADMLCAAGELNEIAEVLRPRVEVWAALNGCMAVLVESREGWARALKPYGYEPWQVSVMKEL